MTTGVSALIIALALSHAAPAQSEVRWGLPELMQELRAVKSAHGKFVERKYLAAKEKNGTGPLGVFGPATEINQQNLEELGRVDRCESCHAGTNRGGFESVTPTYFRSHPYRRRC